MRARHRARWLAIALVALLAVAWSMPALATAAGKGLKQSDRAALLDYARTTWASFVAMTDEESGLPADTLHFDGTRSVQTSTTNIGAYLWSTLVAEELGLISRAEMVQRMSQTLTTLEGMERSMGGQYYNWYDHRTGEKLTVWPSSGDPLTPILSSVDNGWLATGLHIVATAVPELSDRAGALFDSMDFGVYYVPERNLIRFHINPEAPQDPAKSPCCYDTIVSESRIASYIGIAKGELPPKHYFGQWRTFPDDECNWAWQETKPVGFNATYLGVNVFEGAYPYEDFRVVPGWGGSMFEALMPNLFAPEEKWAPRSWKVNHPLTVTAQIHHGLEEAQYGYWGFSPANVPEGGYTEYGVDALGMNPDGYKSNREATLVDRGYEGCRPAIPDPPPAAYTNGVVTPHAAFLALRYAPRMTLENLANLREDFDIYTPWGFRDSVNVDTGRVSDYYLSLDQGIIMAAVGNALAGDILRDAWATKSFTKTLKPIMAMETFNAGPRRAGNALR